MSQFQNSFQPIDYYYDFIAPGYDYRELEELIINSENPLDFESNRMFNLSGEKYHVVKRDDLSFMNRSIDQFREDLHYNLKNSNQYQVEQEPTKNNLYQDEERMANEEVAQLSLTNFEQPEILGQVYGEVLNSLDMFMQPVLKNKLESMPIEAENASFFPNYYQNEQNSFPITKQLAVKNPPPAPRKLVKENKPIHQNVYNEVPYKNQVFLENSLPEPVQEKPRNLYIQWEAPEPQIKTILTGIKVVDANPEDYRKRYGSTLKKPHEILDELKNVTIFDDLKFQLNHFLL